MSLGGECSLTINSRRFSCDLTKDTVELGERLETGGVGHFADPFMGIEEQIFHFFHSHS